MRELLSSLLRECSKCNMTFRENVGLIVGDSGILTDDQVESVFIHLNELHSTH